MSQKVKKILIVDDSKEDLMLLKEYLEKEKHKVYTAGSGQEGLDIARKIKPDLVLLDLILPDIDGFDVCEELKKDKGLPDTKVIIISVKGDVEKVGKVLRIEADDYVVKTLVGEIPDDLTEKIKRHLATK
jgi:DNA-binding response OmpR family regulator